MDPLSATANIITLIQAAVGLGKGIQFLRSLAEIPDEFQELLQELAILQSMASHIQTAISDTDSNRGPGLSSKYSFQGIDPSIIISLKTDLAEISHHLGSLCNRLKKPLKHSTERQIDVGNNGRVSKYNWQREKSYIRRLRRKARTLREYFILCFTICSSSQAYVISASIACCIVANWSYRQLPTDQGNRRTQTISPRLNASLS